MIVLIHRNTEDYLTKALTTGCSGSPKKPALTDPGVIFRGEILRMIKVHGDIWRIEDEDDLYENTEVARQLIEYAEREGKKDDVKWFFEQAYVNFADETVTGIFKSYSISEYKDYLLSVVAKKNEEGEWECSIQKKQVPSKGHPT